MLDRPDLQGLESASQRLANLRGNMESKWLIFQELQLRRPLEDVIKTFVNHIFNSKVNRLFWCHPESYDTL